VSSAPQLQRQLALTRLADAELQLAQSGGRSDLTLSAGVRRFELSDETALVLSAAMPLNFSNPNRGRIAAAQHQQARSQRQQALIEQQLTLSLAELQQRLIHIQSQIQQLRTELLPRAQRLLDQTLSGYRRGRYSVLALTDAQSERFGLEQQLIELRRSAHLQLLELERITGAPLIATSTGEQP
jgi:cobalt-zinc-cadmium efflux system outer membrane protein